MKLSRKVLLLVGAGILVIALAALSLVGFQSADEKGRLGRQLAASQANLQAIRLETLSTQQADLEKRLSQTAPELDAVKSKLSQPVSSTAAATALFGAAKTYGLVVTGLTSTSPANESLEGSTLSAISLTATIQGNASKLGSFIKALNSALKTSAVKSVVITIPDTVSTDNTTPQITNSDNATASLDLVVYTYRGK